MSESDERISLRQVVCLSTFLMIEGPRRALSYLGKKPEVSKLSWTFMSSILEFCSLIDLYIHAPCSAAKAILYLQSVWMAQLLLWAPFLRPCELSIIRTVLHGAKWNIKRRSSKRVSSERSETAEAEETAMVLAVLAGLRLGSAFY